MVRKSVFVVLLFISWVLKGQEQASAEFFLEEYTDKFQNLFFEALKQKGIQNYDRATEKLLACKNLDPTSSVIDFELARTYYLDKKYALAMEYSLASLQYEPENYWYLQHLVSILEKQGNTIDALSGRIDISNRVIQQNLAKIYVQKGAFQKALAILDDMENSEFSHNLRQSIAILSSSGIRQKSKRRFAEKRINPPKSNPLESKKNALELLISSGNFDELKQTSKEAIDAYPLQAYFQYAYGLALVKTNEKKSGIEILEGALEYIFEDIGLKNTIYKVLSETYASIGNEKKANEYANKIETGL